jgi:hypothetical protein
MMMKAFNEGRECWNFIMAAHHLLQAVRHCLREKGLPYKSHFVELWRYENLSPAYLKLNPNGVVPTLVHDGVPVINSLCINEYIDDVFPDPPLRPADPHERARARYWAWTADDVHLSAAQLTHVKMLKARLTSCRLRNARSCWKAPGPEIRERWRRLTEGATPMRKSRRAPTTCCSHSVGWSRSLRSADLGLPARPSRSATSTCSPLST